MFRKIISVLLIVFMSVGVFAKTNFIYADEEDEEEVVEKSTYEKCVED